MRAIRPVVRDRPVCERKPVFRLLPKVPTSAVLVSQPGVWVRMRAIRPFVSDRPVCEPKAVFRLLPNVPTSPILDAAVRVSCQESASTAQRW